MAIISKLASNRLIFSAIRPNQVLTVRHGGHHVFQKRPGQLVINRVKDMMHFYTIGLGFIPAAIILTVVHIIYGSACELTQYPTDGTIPHYWQFERTPLRQFWAKHFGISDAERHEKMLAWHERNTVMARWRKFEERVKHLQGERWDYKGWYYEPVSANWIDYSRFIHKRYMNSREEAGHYKF